MRRKQASKEHNQEMHEANNKLEWFAQCWNCRQHTELGATCEHCGVNLWSRDDKTNQ